MTQEPLWQPSDILNAENEGDAESPKRRGRIPQSAWPRILERHKAGVTLSAIAREFDCTPSAISYIVRKAEASGVVGDGNDAGDASAPPAAAPIVVEPVADIAPAAVEAPRAPRRAPRAAQAEAVDSAEAAPAPVPEPVPVPSAAPVVSVSPEVASTEPNRSDSPFHHDSGRHGEAPRRFEGRENRPLREGREGRPERGERFGQEVREPRPDREPRLDREPRVEREFRGDREPRQDRGQQGERRPQGNLRFPQGGQPGPQRGDRFGDRPPRDRLEVRPPRDRDFDRNGGGEGRVIDRPNPDFNPSEGPAEVVYPYRQQQRNPARLEAAEVPTTPADERMDAAAKACAEAYREWKGQTGSGVQGLTDALHELRKVIARMEIEISASRKEEVRPIPLQAYRTNLPPPQQPRG